LRNHRLLLTFLPSGLTRSYSILPLLSNDLLLRHLSGLKLRPLLTLRTFLPLHLPVILPKYLSLLLRLRAIGTLLLLWLRPEYRLLSLDTLLLPAHLSWILSDDLLLRLPKHALLLRLLPHLRHLSRLLLPHLRHLASLRLRSLLTLLAHLRLAAAALLSWRWASAMRIAAAVALTLTKYVLIQTADKQKAKCDRGNKLL